MIWYLMGFWGFGLVWFVKKSTVKKNLIIEWNLYGFDIQKAPKSCFVVVIVVIVVKQIKTDISFGHRREQQKKNWLNFFGISQKKKKTWISFIVSKLKWHFL